MESAETMNENYAPYIPCFGAYVVQLPAPPKSSSTKRARETVGAGKTMEAV